MACMECYKVVDFPKTRLPIGECPELVLKCFWELLDQRGNLNPVAVIMSYLEHLQKYVNLKRQSFLPSLDTYIQGIFFVLRGNDLNKHLFTNFGSFLFSEECVFTE